MNVKNRRVVRRPVRSLLLATSVVSLTLAVTSSSSWSATSPSLGTASAASVAAGSTVTNTGASVLAENLDLYPGTSVTGFPPGIVGGTENVGGPANGTANIALNDVTAAYLSAQSAAATGSANTDLGGQNLSPGVYAASSTMSLTGTLTLTGTANSVFIFQAVSGLTTASGSRIFLNGGVQA